MVRSNLSPKIDDRKDKLTGFPVVDPFVLSCTMMGIAEKSHTLIRNVLTRNSSLPIDFLGALGPPSLGIGSAFLEMTQRLISNPSTWVHSQLTLGQDYGYLWQQSAFRLAGVKVEPVIRPARNDRRFRDPMWDDSPIFDFIKQSYLILGRWLYSLVHEIDNLDKREARKVDFYTRQFIDAVAPTNFILTNPEVLRATLDSGGKNLILGITNLLSDLERGCGHIKITMSDEKAFKLGDNVATTPGKVIWYNDLIELIHYAPSQAQTYALPLLIVPPWINKYYILDLRPENSFIRWAVEQGYAIFAISWVNPDEKLAHKNFEDYLSEGLFAALDQVLHQTGSRKANVLGYCLGGTLLACGLAVMASRQDSRIHAATFLTSLLDFSEAGDLSVFIDDEHIHALELSMKCQGYLSGQQMSMAFNMLRANDLIWSFVINNYLLGLRPFPFDLLYWNSDSTRMPAAMHSFYLRHMYQDNALTTPGAMRLGGCPVDIGSIQQPCYALAAKEDHIAPWRSVYNSMRMLKGQLRFVLADSGHIAGIINPPSDKPKYGYWTHDNKTEPVHNDPESWLAGTSRKPESWWIDWNSWMAPLSGPLGKAYHPERGKLPILTDAPGHYVRVRYYD